MNRNRYIILGIALVLIVGTIFYLESLKVNNSNTGEGYEGAVKVSDEKALIKKIQGEEYKLAPELTGISGYLNTNDVEVKISDFEGKVVLIDFWTYTCINCIRTLPYLTAWDEKYRDKGLVIIGVHAPEFEFEKERENVIKAMERRGVEYIVVQDNEMETWRAFDNRYWPQKYLIDSEGYIRYEHIGEGGYEETEMKIQELLKEAGESVNEELTKEGLNDGRVRRITTPELYAGVLFSFPRNQYIGNKKNAERLEDYVLPNKLDLKDTIYLDGLWYYNPDNLHLQGEEGIIALDFTAGEVNIVAEPLGANIEMEVLIDEEYVKKEDAGSDVLFEGNRAYVIIDEAKLYNIYDGEYGNFRMDLKVGKDFSFNAFTFG
jgi:thiol-disulfide isomerase/thioredoxin